MPRPLLDDRQTSQALDNYYQAREQAVRYVLAALDPSAFNAPALPYVEVLTRVQALIAKEIAHYAEPEVAAAAEPSPVPAATPPQEREA